MLIYEIQGKRYPSEPEAETKRKMLAHHPPEAEVVVWEKFETYERDKNNLITFGVNEIEIDRLKLNELWNV